MVIQKHHHEALFGPGATTLLIAGGVVTGAVQANWATLKARAKRRRKKGVTGENK